MSYSKKIQKKLPNRIILTAMIILMWTAMTGSSMIWNILQVWHRAEQLAYNEANSNFNKDLVYRRWNTEHGGLYAPITEKTPSNPYLSHIKEHDIFTPSGRALTLINPAYMTRQVHELGTRQYGIRGHITSLDPLRPENMPDVWEVAALRSFTDGKSEVSEAVMLDDERYFRLMRPLITEEKCLSCHGTQGYKVGDLRGGLSVSVPLKPYITVAEANIYSLTFGHLLIWALGLAGFGVSTWSIKQRATESKRSEEALIESEKKYRSIMESMKDATYICSHKFRIEYMNPRMIDNAGSYKTGELCHKAVYDLDEKCPWCAFDQVKQGKHVEYELANPKDNRYYSIMDSPVYHSDGNISKLTILRDITETRAIEAQLRQQQKLEGIGVLAGGVAHEINNPINGIMNYAQLIKDRLNQDNPLIEFAAEIIIETNRIAAIVRNLLAFARYEQETSSPARMSDIVESSLSLIQTVMRRDQITLKADVPDDLPEIRCRIQQIQQVLMNLIINARDALNEKYPNYDENKIIRLSARLFEKEGNKWIRTIVEDHGSGIIPEVREQIFDPFFSTKSREKGTGLGLSISYGIIKDHHGVLHVESEPGQYTRFHVDLPVDNDGKRARL
ncbi:DUF3365 domain-containing protein [Desulfobacterales bacterium HSG16]|nr:DUF3365 domain-containing protein [Desulfobacterales bacterium HSG16]